jgi:hypothetical protein
MKRSRECVPSLLHHRSTGACSASRRWVPKGGETSNGRCSTTISTLPDGRLRLDEEWAWESKPGGGTSAAEEVAQAE